MKVRINNAGIYSQIAFLNRKLRKKVFKLNYALIREVNEISLPGKEYIILVFLYWALSLEFLVLSWSGHVALEFYVSRLSRHVALEFCF